MKKILQFMLLIFLLIIVVSRSIFASSNINEVLQQKLQNATVLCVGNSKAVVNNKETVVDVANPNVYPIIKDGRTLVPVRFISESFGAEVYWNDKTSTVILELNGKQVKLTIDSKNIMIDGINKELDVPAQILNERTFIPLRAMSEALGKQVFWDDRGIIVISDREIFTSKIDEADLIKQLADEFEGNDNTGDKLDYQEIKVSTTEEFLNAIGSNRRLILEAKEYNLLEVDVNKLENNFNYSLLDSNEMIIRDVENLTIMSSDSIKNASILTEYEYAYVLTFNNCSDISLIGLTAGHLIENRECMGGVFCLRNCNNIKIDKCDLFGCGSEGLLLSTVENFNFSDSIIRDCSQGIMTIYDSKNLNFTNSSFINNTSNYDFISLMGTSNVNFDNCNISDNKTYHAYNTAESIFFLSTSSRIKVLNSNINNNNAREFEEEDSSNERIIQESNYFKDNEFEKESFTYNNLFYGLTFEYPKIWKEIQSTKFQSTDKKSELNLALKFFDDTSMSLEDKRNEIIEEYKKQIDKYNIEDIYNITYNENEGITLFFTGNIENINYKFKQIIFFKNNNTYIFTYSAKPENFEDHIKEFEKILTSLKIE